MKRFCCLLAGVLVLLVACVRWDVAPGGLNRLASGVALVHVADADFDQSGWYRRPEGHEVPWLPGRSGDSRNNAGPNLVDLVLGGIGLVGLTGLGGRQR